MDPSTLPLGQIFGGALTLGGIGLIVRLVINYQRDFTDQYRQAMRDQAQRIDHLETKVGNMEGRERELISRLFNCNQERSALRVLVKQAGLPWNPDDWVWHDDTGDTRG